MPRPRAYAVNEVIEAAQNTFWARGYEATAISDLERSTGLNRSSLYLRFSSKRSLFVIALDRYLEDFVDPLLRALDAPGAGLEEVVAFFSSVQELLRHGDDARRGCLLVNTIAGPSIEHPDAERRASAYRDRLRRSFMNALEGAAAAGQLRVEPSPHRAWLLAAATFGIWVSSRINPTDAGELCHAVASEVDSWRRPSVLR